MSETLKPRLAVLLGNFFFGTTVIAIKHLTPALIQPAGLTAVRIVSTMVLFWLLFAIRPEKIAFTKKDFVRLFCCAIAGITMNQTFSMWGMSLTSPIHASLLVLTTPITITLLASIVLKETLTLNKIAGLALGIIGGAFLVFARDTSSAAGADQSLGDLFVVFGAISYAIYVIAIKPLTAKHKSTHVLQWVFTFGACFSLPIGWRSLQAVEWHAFDRWDWFCLAYCVLGATFFAYQLMNYGISKLGASVTGSYIYTQPFFAALASVLIVHERITFSKVVAALLIGTGVFLANYKKLAARG